MNAISVQSLIDGLSSLEIAYDENGVEANANAYMDGDELVLQLNEAAAVNFCRLVLETASRPFFGAHQHFDQTNFLDSGSGRLRIENRS